MRTSTFINKMFTLVHTHTHGRVTSVDHMKLLASDLWINLNLESAFTTPEIAARDFVNVLGSYRPIR